MAGPLYADRVAQTTTTTGTGTLNLEATIADGVRGFVSGIGTGNTCFYCISHQSADEWEVGIGTVTDAATDTLSRTTILASSNSNNAVSLSAGTKDVFCVAPANYGLPLIIEGTGLGLRRANPTEGGATAGNARGTAAVDLQGSRNAATQVASGNYSVIAGGFRNTASGSHSFVGAGRDNTATAACAVVGGGRLNDATSAYSCVLGGYNNTASTNTHATVGGGLNNTASGQYSFVGGGYRNVASGTHSVVVGGAANTATATGSTAVGVQAVASRYGQFAQASGRFSADGDAQASQYVLRAQTTDDAATEMFLDGSSSRLALSNDSTWAFKVLVVARRTDANDESAAYEYVGCIDRNAAANTTALVGSVTEVFANEDNAAWAVSIDADTTNGSLRIQVTGEAAKSINWVAYVRTVEVVG
jgi:hypothetical protein